MSVANERRFTWCVLISLFSLLASFRAEPCAKVYMLGLDATTTDYPQFAGVYRLQTSFDTLVTMHLVMRELKEYPVYRHESEQLFLYYNSTKSSLMLGTIQSRSLLVVEKTPGTEISSDVDYSQDQLFAYSRWKQWDPRQRQYLERSALSNIKPHCVDENFGLCSSGYLYPSNLLQSEVQVYYPEGAFGGRETIDFSRIHFRLSENVVHNSRPVYDLVSELQVHQRYLYHQGGKWRVGGTIGSEDANSGIILELEGNAMRVEYENGTEWNWLYFYVYSRPTSSSPRRAFERLQCRRKLPDGVSCQDAGACKNGGSCQTDSAGESSCACPSGCWGIQCEQRVPECVRSFPTPSQAFVFGTPGHQYHGSVTTVFCPSGTVQYAVCRRGSWQTISTAVCQDRFPVRSTTTLSSTAHSTGSFGGGEAYRYKDSTATVATVIVVLVCVQLCCPLLCYCCVVCCRSDEEQDEEVPADETLKISTQKQKTSLQRVCSGFFYVSWWLWLGFVAVYFIWYGHLPLDGSSALSAAAIMAFVCLGLLYCCVFSESFCSHEYDYLSKLEDEVTAGEQITEMKATKPTLTFKADCWHNETKTRQVYRNNRMQTETYTEKVTTAVIEEPFSYSDWFDASPRFSPPTSDVTKVHVELAIEFADEESKRVYDAAFAEFKDRHLARDVHVDFSMQDEIEGFVKRLAVHDPDRPLPSWMSTSCFCLASCCFFTWPYRFIFNSAVSSYNYRIVKKIVARPQTIVNQPQRIPSPIIDAPSAPMEPFAPPPFPPPAVGSLHCLDETIIPFLPADEMPAVPPPSYEEFIANPVMFDNGHHGKHESIPLSPIM